MWSIECTVNTVVVPNECVADLFDEAQDYEGELWDDIDEVTDENGKLYFNSDHMEHMDYLARQDKVIKILKRYEVEGDICFQSLEGDNAGSSWGYRFDGKGGMKNLTGKVTWGEQAETFKGKRVVVTGTLSCMTRGQAEAKIRKAEGKTSDTVSGKTDYLVVGENPGSKLERAKKLRVKIIREKDFLEMLGEE